MDRTIYPTVTNLIKPTHYIDYYRTYNFVLLLGRCDHGKRRTGIAIAVAALLKGKNYKQAMLHLRKEQDEKYHEGHHHSEDLQGQHPVRRIVVRLLQLLKASCKIIFNISNVIVYALNLCPLILYHFHQLRKHCAQLAHGRVDSFDSLCPRFCVVRYKLSFL